MHTKKPRPVGRRKSRQLGAWRRKRKTDWGRFSCKHEFTDLLLVAGLRMWSPRKPMWGKRKKKKKEGKPRDLYPQTVDNDDVSGSVQPGAKVDPKSLRMRTSLPGHVSDIVIHLTRPCRPNRRLTGHCPSRVRSFSADT